MNFNNKEDNYHDINTLIEKTVLKARRRKRTINLIVSLSLVFAFIGTFVIVINTNDDFYTYALDQPFLRPIVEKLRFNNIYEDSEKIVIERKDYKLNVLNAGQYEDFSVIKRELDLLIDDTNFFHNVISDGKNLYMVEMMSGDVSAYAIGIWKYDISQNELTKILDLPYKEGEYVFNLDSYSVIDDIVYLSRRVSDEDDNLWTEIMKMEDGELVTIDNSLTNLFHFYINTVNFFKVNNQIIYTTLEKNDDKYCYVVNSGVEKYNLTCYEDELNAAYIPVLRHEMSNQRFDLYSSIMTNSPDWRTHGKEAGKEESIVVYDKLGKVIFENDEAVDYKLEGEHLLLQYIEEDNIYNYEIVNLNTLDSQEYKDETEFYYGLQDIGIESYAFEVENDITTDRVVTTNNPVFVTYKTLGYPAPTNPERFLSIVSDENSVIISTTAEDGIMHITLIKYNNLLDYSK